MTTPSDAQPVAWLFTDTQGTRLTDNKDIAKLSHDQYEPLYPQSALDAERQKREAAERERDELDFLLNEGGSWEAQLSKAEACAETAEASLAKANATIERLTAEGLYISEQFSGAAGDIVKLRARIAELEAALRPFGTQKQTYADFIRAQRAALADIEKERDDEA